MNEKEPKAVFPLISNSAVHCHHGHTWISLWRPYSDTDIRSAAGLIAKAMPPFATLL
jgi:hypothetical protein